MSHDHVHWPAGETAPAGGPVVLEIGDTVGALIVELDRSLIGHELHVRRVHESGSTTHTGIWERSLVERTVTVAVFAELEAGHYDVFDLAGAVVMTVAVQAGEVTETSLILALAHR